MVRVSGSSLERLAIEYIARMPFITRAELSALLGVDAGEAGRVFDALRERSLIEVVRWMSSGGSPSQRGCLTASGARELGRLKGFDLRELAEAGYVVSVQQLRTVLHRAELVGLFYGLSVMATEELGHACVWHWRRADWLEGTLEVGPDRLLRVMRIGRGVERRAIASRLGAMVNAWQSQFVNSVLVLCCDSTTRAYVAGWFRGGARGIYAWAADERELLDVGMEARSLSGEYGGRLSYLSLGGLLRSVTESYDAGGADVGVGVEARERVTALPERGLQDRRRFRGDLLALEMSEAERALVDLLADWPLAAVGQLSLMSGYGKRYVEVALKGLRRRKMVWFGDVQRDRVVLLAEPGLRYLTWRDRVLLGQLKRSWRVDERVARRGVVPAEGMIGDKLRGLARFWSHTRGVYDVVSAIAAGWRERSDGDLLELVPAHRSERWTRGSYRPVGVKPDASGVMQVAGRLRRPFLLEYERRADAPATMSEKLGPYRRYYADFMRNEHWRATVVTLFVFEDAGAAGRFVVHCRRDSAAPRVKAGQALPIFVTSLSRLRSEGGASRCWVNGGHLDEGTFTLAEAMSMI